MTWMIPSDHLPGHSESQVVPLGYSPPHLVYSPNTDMKAEVDEPTKTLDDSDMDSYDWPQTNSYVYNGQWQHRAKTRSLKSEHTNIQAASAHV